MTTVVRLVDDGNSTAAVYMEDINGILQITLNTGMNSSQNRYAPK